MGVNKYQRDEEPEIAVLDIDNTAVRASQLARLEAVKRSRDGVACAMALAAMTRAAAEKTGNLLELAVTAARHRATVGEISDSLESAYGRHKAVIQSISGVYGSAYAGDGEFLEIQSSVAAFAREEGRRPRLLVVKLGQDGHDRGPKSLPRRLPTLALTWTSAPSFKPRRSRPSRGGE